MRENQKGVKIKGNKVYEEYKFVSPSIWLKPVTKPKVFLTFWSIEIDFHLFFQKKFPYGTIGSFSELLEFKTYLCDIIIDSYTTL